MSPVDAAGLVGDRVRGIAEYAPEPLEAVSERLGMAVEDLIKLDANENPYGPTEHALSALRNYDAYHLYPDAISRRLRQAIGEWLHVDPECIVVGNGSDELIDLIFKLLRPGPDGGGIARVLDCQPTFGMYRFYGTSHDLEVVDVPRRGDFALDVPAIEAFCDAHGGASILFVASPNNPDGRLLPEEDLQHLLALPLLVVLDEAYVDFSGMSRVRWVAAHENLIVLRTFSKWAGLAGLRVGYGVFPGALMTAVWRLKSPYNVNVAAQVAALATLEHLEEAKANVARIVSERRRLVAELRRLPSLCVYDSDANFVLLDVRAVGADRVREAMEARGILLRYYHGEGRHDHVRVTVGTPAQNDVLLEVFRALDERSEHDGRQA